MGLQPGQVFSGGFVRDADGRIVVVMEPVSGTPQPLSAGQTSDQDGRMIVVVEQAS